MYVPPVSDALLQTQLKAREDTAQADDKSNSKKQDQLWTEADILVECKPYKKTICPRFIFINFALFVSYRIKTWRITCITLSLTTKLWGQIQDEAKT